MTNDELTAISLVSQMKRFNLTLTEALEAMQEKANDKQFQAAVGPRDLAGQPAPLDVA